MKPKAMKALGHPSYSSHPSQPNFPVIPVTLVILGHSQKSEVAGWTKTKEDILEMKYAFCA